MKGGRCMPAPVCASPPLSTSAVLRESWYLTRDYKGVIVRYHNVRLSASGFKSVVFVRSFSRRVNAVKDGVASSYGLKRHGL